MIILERQLAGMTIASPPAADACDTADAMELALLQHPELEDKREEIQQARSPYSTAAFLPTAHASANLQGVDRWQLKVQRAADKNLDKFELYALKNVFAIPEDVQLVRRRRLSTPHLPPPHAEA